MAEVSEFFTIFLFYFSFLPYDSITSEHPGLSDQSVEAIARASALIPNLEMMK
jgi:hypothetical protein